MLLRVFENAVHKHSSASYAVRVSLPLWRELAATEQIASSHPTTWPGGCNDCPVVYFIGSLLIVIDPAIDIRGQQFFFLPKLSASEKDATTVLENGTKTSDAGITTKAKSPLAEGFLNRHATRWMGRS